MTPARIQPFSRKYNINIGCFNGKKITRRNNTQRNKALFIHNNLFCLIWKSNESSFDKAIEEELKPDFKVVDNVMSDTHVKRFFKDEFKPKKLQSPITNITVDDLETYNTDRVVPYCSCIYKLSKNSGNYNRVITEEEYEKCKQDCIVFKGTNSINGMLDFVLPFKRKAKKVIS